MQYYEIKLPGVFFSARISCCYQNAEHHQLPVADLGPARSGSDSQRLPRPSQGREPHLNCSGHIPPGSSASGSESMTGRDAAPGLR